MDLGESSNCFFAKEDKFAIILFSKQQELIFVKTDYESKNQAQEDVKKLLFEGVLVDDCTTYDTKDIKYICLIDDRGKVLNMLRPMIGYKMRKMLKNVKTLVNLQKS
ncbi:MAG: hypothetical protein ABFQ53_02135 [Patescibacteria group bacterium]